MQYYLFISVDFIYCSHPKYHFKSVDSLTFRQKMEVESTEPMNPFRVPVNYFEAMAFYVFQYQSRGDGNEDTVNYRGVTVRRAVYMTYMQLIEEYVKKYQTLSCKRDIVTTTRNELVIASNEEDNAYRLLIDFVVSCVPYVNNLMHVEEGVVPHIEIDEEPAIIPTTTILYIPCGVISMLVMNEINNGSFNSLEDAMIFVTHTMVGPFLVPNGS